MNYLLRVYDKQNKLGPKGDSEQDRVDFDKWTLFLLSSLGPMMVCYVAKRVTNPENVLTLPKRAK